MGRGMATPTAALLLLAAAQVASAEESSEEDRAQTDCERLFDEAERIRNVTVPSENETKAEWDGRKLAAQNAVLSLLQECSESRNAADKEFAVEAYHRQSFVHFDKGRHRLAVGALRRARALDPTLNTTWRLASALSLRLNEHTEAEDLLAASLAQLAVAQPGDNEADRGDMPEGADWSLLRERVLALPAGSNYSDVIQHDAFAPLALQELIGLLRRRHAVAELRDTLRFALIISPYNRQLRKAVLSMSGQTGDVWACWRAHTQPPGWSDTMDTAVRQIFYFLTQLPQVAWRLAQSVLASEDPDGEWAAAVQEELTELCGVSLTVDAEMSGVSLADLRSVIAKCMAKQGVVEDFKRLAASLDPPSTLLTLLQTPPEGEDMTPLHAAAAMGEEVLRVVTDGLGDVPQPPGLHQLTPAHVLWAAGGESEGAASADEWGRAPGELAPCWVSPPCDDGGISKAQEADRVGPDSEWSRKGLDRRAVPPEGFKAYEVPDFLQSRLSECSIAASKGVKEEMLVKQHYTTGHPIMLRSALSKKARKEQAHTFSFSFLAKALGGALIPVGEVHHLESAPPGTPSPTTALAAFAFEHMHKGLSTTLEGPMRGPFKEVVAIPSAAKALADSKTESGFTFRVGGGGAGRGLFFATTHRLDMLHSGRRFWALLPPESAYFSSLPPVVAMETLLQNHTTLVCQQFSGDALYVPPGWAAVAVNLRESVGWEAEYGWGSVRLFHDEPAPAREVPVDLPAAAPAGGKRRGGSVVIGSDGQKRDEKDEL